MNNDNRFQTKISDCSFGLKAARLLRYTYRLIELKVNVIIELSQSCCTHQGEIQGEQAHPRRDRWPLNSSAS